GPSGAADRRGAPCPGPGRARSSACSRARTPPRRLSGSRAVSCLDLRHAAQRLLDLRRRVLVVLQLAGEELLVRAEVEVAVAGQVEENRLALAVFLASQRLVDGDFDRVRRFGGGNDALAA